MTNLVGAERNWVYPRMAKPAVLLAAVIIALLALPAAALAQDEPAPRCHPIAGWLASQIGGQWNCDALMDLQAEGNGYGQMAKAWYLSHYVQVPTDDGDWTDLIAAPHEGNGWGELAHAVRLADALSGLEVTVTPEELLDLRQGQEPGQEIGWGQLRHAAALAAADLGLSFDDALDRLTSGDGWRADGDEQGPPPWAGKSKIKLPKPGKAARHSGDE